jgi:hypothetical protein
MKDVTIAQALDDLEAPFDDEPEQWEDVVRRARNAEPPAPLHKARPVRRSRRFKLRWAIRASLAAAVAAAVTLALLPGSHPGPTFIDRALAAVPANGPIVHVVTESSCCPDISVAVTVATGHESPLTTRSETWLDSERRQAHVVSYLEGTRYDDLWRSERETLDSVTGKDFPYTVGTLDAGAVLFAHYRELLRSGDAKIVGHGVYAGHTVDWIELTYPVGAWETGRLPGAPAGSVTTTTARIAIDHDSGTPVGATFPDSPGVEDRYLTVEYLPRAAANLERPALPALPRPPLKDGYALARSRTRIATDKVTAVLGKDGLWAGPHIGTLELTAAVEVDFGRGEPRNGVELLYGAADGNQPQWTGEYVRIGLSRSPEWVYKAPGYPSGGTMLIQRDIPTADVAPSIPLGGVRWTGALERDGLFVSIQAPTKDQVIRTAQALRALDG